MKSKKNMYNIIYRLRNRGLRIDTRERMVFPTFAFPVEAGKSPPLLKKLCSQYGFNVQLETFESGSRSRVYISGPISHYDLKERQETFAKAEHLLRKQGYLPINPFKNGISQAADWHLHMRKDFTMLLTCQYIYFLPEWEKSKGCRLELDVAVSSGLNVLKF